MSIRGWLDERLLCVGAGLVLLAAAGGSLGLWPGPKHPSRPLGRTHPPELPRNRLDATDSKALERQLPVASGPGTVRLFDLFTPPEPKSDPGGGGNRPAALVGAPRPTLRLEEKLRLLAVRRELFPLQLVGYAGPISDPLGVFADLRTGVTWLGRTGDCVPGRNLRLQTMRVERRAVVVSSEGAVPGWLATAVLRDGDTGVCVTLTDRTRCHAGGRRALIAVVGEKGPPREFARNQVVQALPERALVVAIHMNPPSVDIRRLGRNGPVGEVRILRENLKTTAPSERNVDGAALD